MKKVFFLLFCIELFIPTTLSAETIFFNANNKTSIEGKIIKSDQNSTIVKFSLSGVEKFSSTDDQKYTEIALPGAALTMKKGYPELPRISQNILIPKGARVRVAIIKQNTVTMDLGVIKPSKGHLSRAIDPKMVPLEPADLYDKGGQFPESLFSISSPFVLRHLQGVNITFYPLIFDAASGLTEITTELILEVKTKGSQKFVSNKIHVPNDFYSFYKTRFANFDLLFSNSLSGHLIDETGLLVIISPPKFLNLLAPLVQWKKDKGFNVQLKSLAEIGTDYLAIKKFVKEAYFSSDLAYVVLVGDSDTMPFHPLSSKEEKAAAADPLYMMVDGDDNYPDLFLSRIPVQTEEELKTVVNKLIKYEKYPDHDGEWYHRASGIASAEGEPPDYARAEILRKKLLTWHYEEVDQLYESHGGGVSSQKIANALDEGRGFINYIGHGTKTAWATGPFTNSNIDSLSNDDMLPFIVSVACFNGSFVGSSDSLAERWLKAGTPEIARGAIAILASSIEQPWVPPTVGQGAIVDLLISEKAKTIGGLFVNGMSAILEDTSEEAITTVKTWHIFGDVSLEVRTKKPAPIVAEVPSFISDQTKVLRIFSEKNIVAVVSFHDEVIGSARSDKDGIISLIVPDLPRGESLKVTLSGFNKVPREELVGVK